MQWAKHTSKKGVRQKLAIGKKKCDDSDYKSEKKDQA